MTETEENLNDSGQIIYDWNPPTGILENYTYQGEPITKTEVYICLYSGSLYF